MKPPDVKRPGSAAARPGRESGSPERRVGANPSGDPREFQGIANGRHAGQRPPRWGRPPQAGALDELDRAFGAARRFVVVVIALNRRTEWGRFPDIEAANDAASRLLRHGMHAVVERIKGGS